MVLKCCTLANQAAGPVPPMEFGYLRVLINDQHVQSGIDDLLKMKLVSDEKTLIKPIGLLDEWLNTTISNCKNAIGETPANHQKAD